MTKRECAIVMAFTGVAMLKGDDLDIFYQYIAEVIGRPVYTHEIAMMADDIKESARADFIQICHDAAEGTELQKVSSRPKSEQYICPRCGSFCYYPHCKKGIQYRFCPNCGKEVRGYA